MYQPWTVERLAQHKLVILGLGREGWSSFQYLRKALPKAEMLLVDELPLSELNAKWSKCTERDQNVQYKNISELKSLPSEALIIKTPGLPPSHPLLKKSKSLITSNTQLFFDFLATQTGLPKVTTIGVTGTKGKSTTSSLLAHVLSSSKEKVLLGGNIGVPPLDLLPAISAESKSVIVVLELSAHQLADLKTSPLIAVVQNVVPEHLDYYATFTEYVAAKKQITRWQNQDGVVVFNPDYSTSLKIAKMSPGKRLQFRIETFDQWLLYLDEPIIKLSDIPLVGEHNLQNVMPSIVIGKHLGLETLTIARAIHSFTPLEHRLEFVAEVEGVRYYNDSLSTLPEATIAALDAFTDQSIVLLAGGHERHQDFSELATAILSKPVKAVLLFSTTGERLQQEIEAQSKKTKIKLIPVPTMKKAVHEAASIAKSGDVVLLSPASPSFGEFKDYKDRGNQFRAAVDTLRK